MTILSLIKNETSSNDYQVKLSFKDNILSFPLQWIIFGSSSSTDIDLLILLPSQIIGNLPHVYLELIKEFDKSLPSILSHMIVYQPHSFKATDYWDKPINSTFGSINESEGYLSWAFKGGHDETNNSILTTFNGHPQMFSNCPITKLLDRDVEGKVLRMLRMTVGCLCSATYSNEILTNTIKQKKLTDLLKYCFGFLTNNGLFSIQSDRRTLGLKEIVNLLLIAPFLNRYIVRTVKASGPYHKLLQPIAKMHQQLLSISGSKQNQIGIYSLRKQMVQAIENRDLVKVNQIIEKYMNNFSIIHQITNDIITQIEIIINYSPDLDDSPKFIFGESPNINFVEIKNNFVRFIPEIKARAFTLATIASFVVKLKACGLALGFLERIEWELVDLGRESIDKFKKIAFQVGQTHALISGIELYDKESVRFHYPGLQPFLLREPYDSNKAKSLTQLSQSSMTQIQKMITNSKLNLTLLTSET